MKESEEMQCIERVRRGDPEAFSYLVKKYQNIVFSIALKMLRNREDAEEMAQEVFVKAYRSINNFKGTARFSTWLYSIAYNSSISFLRKRKYTSTSIDGMELGDEEANEPFESGNGDSRVACLEKALSKLPADDYTLVLLYYYEEQSVEDICRITGLGESNVKVKLHRARKKLELIMNELMKKEIYSPI